MSLFEQASRLKVRFDSSKGQLTTEDLWDLSLPSLDTIAKGVNKQLRTAQEESFINVKTPNDTILELKLELLKHVIAEKIAEKAARVNAEHKQQEIATLQGLLAEKHLEGLRAMSVDDMKARLAALKAS